MRLDLLECLPFPPMGKGLNQALGFREKPLLLAVDVEDVIL